MGKYKNVYVITPANYATGGIELAHQLVDYLRNKGENAYIVYIGKDNNIIKDVINVTPAYAKYNIKISTEIDDSPSNILILPEVFFDFIYVFKRIRIGCWWMSVDNRYKYVAFTEFVKNQKGFYRKVKVVLSHYLRGSYSNYKNTTKDLIKNNHRMVHFYQSYYAFNHLSKLGFSNIAPLSDFINIELFERKEIEKENIVLYNPAKGFEYTKKIIDLMPDCVFIPLKGLTRSELSRYMGRAKLYIDFGGFPGKDRLPREAAINGCCIITGRFGASNYYQDVPIKDEYKFEIKKNVYPQIVKKINYVLNNYEKCNCDFDYYRSVIKNEQSLFYKEIDDIFL